MFKDVSLKISGEYATFQGREGGGVEVKGLRSVVHIVIPNMRGPCILHGMPMYMSILITFCLKNIYPILKS